MTFLLTADQVSDIRGAARLLPTLPAAETLLADKGCDSDRFRAAPTQRGISPCIPGRAHRKNPIVHEPGLYKHHNRIERMFSRLKDWRRIATRYDRCVHPFFSAICLAAVRSRTGHDVLLIDADKQASANLWAGIRQEETCDVPVQCVMSRQYGGEQ